MHILITGGAGFIGRHIAAEAVRQGHQVRIVSRRPTQISGTECVSHDLSEPVGTASLLEGIDAVIHCAASLAGDAAAQNLHTIGATRNLVAALAGSDVTRVVHLSSLAVYDFERIRAWSDVTESSPTGGRPGRHPYVLAKQAQESLIVDSSTGARRPWAILRPGLVFGTGRTWFHHLGAAMHPRLWLALAPPSPLPLCHVENVADAAILALDAAHPAGVTVNLVDDDLPARGDYLDALAAHAPARPIIVPVPWGMLSAAASVAASFDRTLGNRLLVPDLLVPASLAARCKPFRYPNAAAHELLGWKARRTWREALPESLGTESEPARGDFVGDEVSRTR